ncbi:unnamed protein product [Boreogadus saida]
MSACWPGQRRRSNTSTKVPPLEPQSCIGMKMKPPMCVGSEGKLGCEIKLVYYPGARAPIVIQPPPTTHRGGEPPRPNASHPAATTPKT